MTSPEVVVLKDVDYVREERQILAGVELTIRAGEHWAMIGPNGAGKSTILSLCGALGHPTRGSVDVLGHRIGRVDIGWLRRSIGHVNPRHPLRSPLSAFQVILTGATGSIELVPRWSPDAGMIERARRLTETLGLTVVRNAAWPTLSQGERGLTLIARALLLNPPLLLLDEPSTGLDIAAREQLLQAIDHLHRTQPALTTVLVTHHLEELPASTTHAALIKQGEVLAAGSARSVLTTQTISDCFDYPITIEHRGGRWQARAQGDAAWITSQTVTDTDHRA